jgi:hypothetical protein
VPSENPLETPTGALYNNAAAAAAAPHYHQNNAAGNLPGGIAAQNQQATGLDLYGTNEGLILLHDSEDYDDDDDFDSDSRDSGQHRGHRRRHHHHDHEAVQSGAIGDEHNPPSDHNYEYDEDDEDHDDYSDDYEDGGYENEEDKAMEGTHPGNGGIKHGSLVGWKRIPTAVRARFARYDAMLAHWADESLRMKERLELVEAELAEMRERLGDGRDGGGGRGEQREQQQGGGGDDVAATIIMANNNATETDKPAVENDNDNGHNHIPSNG